MALLAAEKHGGALLPPPQNRSHHARAAASMHDRDNPERTFIRRTGYEVIPNVRETQRSRG